MSPTVIIIIIIIIVICAIGYKTGYIPSLSKSNTKTAVQPTQPTQPVQQVVATVQPIAPVSTVKEYRGNNGTVSGVTYCAGDYENSLGVGFKKNMICTGVHVDNVGDKDCNYVAGLGTAQTVYCKSA